MNKKDKERIALILIEMAKEIAKFVASPEYQPYHTDFFFLSSFDEEREQILVHLLGDPVYAAKFSEEYLEKLLKEKIREMIHTLRQVETLYESPRKIARRTSEAIFNELDSYTTNLTVYLPITGLNIQLEEGMFEIGNITFQNMTQERIDEVIRHITSTIIDLRYTSDEKQNLINYSTEQLQEVFKEKERAVFAVYHIVAEPILAEKRAREECYKVFDLLRYALPMLSSLYPMGFSIPRRFLDNDEVKKNKYPQRERKAQTKAEEIISFGLENEIGAYTDMVSTIIILRNPPGFNWRSSKKEQPRSLLINAHAIEGLKLAKVFEASTTIQKGDTSQTNFERCILRSIHWFANAQTPMQPEYVFLSLMSSIEAFLNPPDRSDVTTAIVEGAAALGGTAGYPYVKKRIDELYGKRSTLSHGDHADIMERDIAELRAVAFYLIHQMLQSTDEFTTQRQFFEEVRKLREEINQQLAENTSLETSQQ